MLTKKIRDWKAGELLRSFTPSEITLNFLEKEIIALLEKSAPEGTVIIDVHVDVKYSVLDKSNEGENESINR